jgi:hypothetical protein
MSAVPVGTTIPQGLILQLAYPLGNYTPTPAYESVTIKSVQQGGGSEVDQNFWSAWTNENAENPLYVNGQIYET